MMKKPFNFEIKYQSTGFVTGNSEELSIDLIITNDFQ